MKTLRRLAVFLLLVAMVYGALWTWQSPYYALWQIDRGLRERDVGRVERYLDLEAVVRAASRFLAALAVDEAGAGGEDLGSRILGGIVGVVADTVGEAVAADGARALRRAILEGRVERGLGPFRLHDGVAALGGMQRFERTALVDLDGTCNGQEASLRVVFEAREGPYLGQPRRYVLTGIDEASLKELVRRCRAGARP